MEKLVTITSQGQLTIPRFIRELFKMRGSVKARVRVEGARIIVEPTSSLSALAGSLHSSVRLSDAELRAARRAFERQWPRKKMYGAESR